MARKVQVLLVDDIDDSAAARNITFSIEGDHYEIDLAQANIDRLHKALEPFIAAARKVKRPGRTRGSSSSRSGRRGVEPAVIRQWAKEQGMEVSERGRVSKEVLQAYEAAH